MNGRIRKTMKLLTALALSLGGGGTTRTTMLPLLVVLHGADAFVGNKNVSTKTLSRTRKRHYGTTTTTTTRRRINHQSSSSSPSSSSSSSSSAAASFALYSSEPRTTTTTTTHPTHQQLPSWHPPVAQAKHDTTTTITTTPSERMYTAFSPLQRKIVSLDPTTFLDNNSNNNNNNSAFWILVRIENWYRQALALRCPFLRRRASDALDVLEALVRNLCLTDRQRQVVGPPVALRPCTSSSDDGGKELHLSTHQVMARLREDWKVNGNHKGYYITGKLSTKVYRDDCTFDGPDPDMPVHGLRKYLNAACQLFETKRSTAELLSLHHDATTDLITAHWRMQGVLQLPWRPALPTVLGTTTYHRDAQGLIDRHVETWDNTTVFKAFLFTLLPRLARQIRKTSDEEDDEEELKNRLDEPTTTTTVTLGHYNQTEPQGALEYL